MGMSKISVTVEDEVLETARRESQGNLSSYVNEALKRHGRRAVLRRLVEEWEQERGRPFSREELDEAGRRWVD